MTTQEETAPAAEAAKATTSEGASDAVASLHLPHRSPCPEEDKTVAAAANAAANAAASALAAAASSSPIVPVRHASRGGGIVEAPAGWGQALSISSSSSSSSSCSSEQQEGKKR